MTDMRVAASAAILAGGQSRRMGVDKAMLPFGGQPLLARVIQTLRRLVDDVCVIGDRPEYHQFGVPVRPDGFGDSGTLGGIATALKSARHDRVLVVACDMPLLSIPLLEAMIAEPRDYDALVPVTAAGRSQQGGNVTYETLHAIYARDCLPAIEARLEQGRLKVIGFFDEVRVRVLDEEWLRRWDPSLQSFMNTNDRAEFERALQLARLE